MSTIQISQDFFAEVDEEDFERVGASQWYLVRRPGYLFHAHRKENNRTIYMHCFVLNWIPRRGLCVDHINGDGLDNRKENLRIVSARMNALNSDRSRQAKGIEKHGNRWRVRPYINGVRTNLGTYPSEEEAKEVWGRYRDAT